MSRRIVKIAGWLVCGAWVSSTVGAHQASAVITEERHSATHLTLRVPSAQRCEPVTSQPGVYAVQEDGHHAGMVYIPTICTREAACEWDCRF